MNTQRERCSRAFSNPKSLVMLIILAILVSAGLALLSKCHRESQLRESSVRVNEAGKKQD